MQQNQQQNQQTQQQRRKPVDKTLPIDLDSPLFSALVSLEKRLDKSIQFQRLSLFNQVNEAKRESRFLRIFISSSSSDQFILEDQLSSTPSWSLKLEAKLLEPVVPRGPPKPSPKFSYFVSRIFVEIVRDQQLFPDSNFIEWVKTPGMPEVDGFEIKRRGDADVLCKIQIHLDYNEPRFKLASDLARFF